MKLLVSIALIALLSFAASLYFPWWCIAVVALIVITLIPQPPLHAFLAGFISIFILWSVMAFWISINNEHILARRISLIILKMEAPLLLVLLTGFIGALIAGLAALAGSFLRKPVTHKSSDYHVH
ncbi:MAG: hypothetical protein WKF97_22295 [Chitinophagaceae bacterium]